MRRKDREITDKQQINAIIEACDCCRIAFPAEDAPYIVPLNFGYTDDKNKRTLYFHGAKEGRKIDLINKTDYVGFEIPDAFVVGYGLDYDQRYRNLDYIGVLHFDEE